MEVKKANMNSIERDMNIMYNLIEFTEELQDKELDFYCNYLPESGSKFEPKGKHLALTKIKDTYDIF